MDSASAVDGSPLLSRPVIAGTGPGGGYRCSRWIPARVVGVHDGDSLTVMMNGQKVRIRIEGVDAPEKGQAFGDKSKAALSLLVAGHTVHVDATGTDRYGRTLARVYADGADVGRKMIRHGWAWHFTRYNKDVDLAIAQVEAKEKRAGIWADPDPPLPPWEWRKAANVRE